MPNEEEKSQEDATEKLYAFVAQEMKAGTDKASIAKKLEEKGIDTADADHIVETAYGQIAAVVKKEQFSPDALAPAILVTLVAAVVGGAVWAGIVIATDYEVGFVAWGIGTMCGYAVILASGGRKGTPLQIIAVLGSVLGILIGKYFTFFYFLKQAVEKEYGTDAAANVSIFSEQVMQYFAEQLSNMLGGYDLLWVVLAVITAWSIPKASGIKLLGRGRSG